MIPIPRFVREASSIRFLLPVFLYLATLTADYYWDGLIFALQIEKTATNERFAPLLFHQNPLLYSGFGYLLFSGVQMLGMSVRALTLLQVANVFVCAVALLVFFRLVERLTRSRCAAVVSSAALAFSAIWWKLSTDANAYLLSVLFLGQRQGRLQGPSKPAFVI